MRYVRIDIMVAMAVVDRLIMDAITPKIRVRLL